MTTFKRLIVLCFICTLVACGDSPSSRWMKYCKGTQSECKCMADSLTKKIEKKDFIALLDQLEQLDKNGKNIGDAIFKEGLVNKDVSMAFLQTAKACKEMDKSESKEKRKEEPIIASPPVAAQAPVEAPVAPAQAAPVLNAADQELNSINGIWYSSQWKYGYELKNGVGVATSSNSPKFAPGDIILRLRPVMFGQFEGEQMYKDGKFYKVNVSLTADGRLYFEGDKNVKWYMDKVK
ncbi:MULTISPECIES: hypothetical protein [unclassified Polynucleobacter]|uniref:hypothetical protein n=1 Tax=unclassified Polynucleobacter TaxID=2640945 RepID=UPI00249089D7|nr:MULTISPECIES: hypothetical protein [unclassified Polynucleobacter]